MNTHNCYVGSYYGHGGMQCFELAQTHPSEFKKTVDGLSRHIWTNNPYVVDCYPAERVIVAPLGGGSPKLARLSSHPEWEKFSQSFSTGEFWAMMGEDWVNDLEQSKLINS